MRTSPAIHLGYRPLDREMMSLQLCRWKFSPKKLCSRLFRQNLDFYLQKQQNRVLMPPFGGLSLTYTVHLWLVGNRVVDFLLVLIDLFSPALTVEALRANIDRNYGVRKGVGHFECTF